jgi:hypothetical protein
MQVEFRSHFWGKKVRLMGQEIQQLFISSWGLHFNHMIKKYRSVCSQSCGMVLKLSYFATFTSEA